MQDIILLHRPSSSSSLSLLEFLTQNGETPWIFWKTCLRQIAFAHCSEFQANLVPDDVEIYEGDEAYAFCLEIICGLHSPLVGETEVFGQFKNLFAETDFNQFTWGPRAQQFMQNLITDAKQVRHQHLYGMGSQSYGSALRRYSKGLKNMAIIGAGHLSQEIYPWIKKDGVDVQILIRDEAKLEAAKEKFDGAKITTLKEKNLSLQGLIVAAPMTGCEFKEWMTAQNIQTNLILDLRDVASTDSISIAKGDPTDSGESAEVVKLQDLFKEIESTKAELSGRVQAAKENIQHLAQKRGDTTFVRPFGWDDLCA